MAELFLLQERAQPAPPWLSSGDVLRLRRHGSHLGRPQVGAFHTCHSRAWLGSAGMAEKGICSRLPFGAGGQQRCPKGAILQQPRAGSGVVAWSRLILGVLMNLLGQSALSHPTGSCSRFPSMRAGERPTLLFPCLKNRFVRRKQEGDPGRH